VRQKKTTQKKQEEKMSGKYVLKPPWLKYGAIGILIVVLSIGGYIASSWLSRFIPNLRGEGNRQIAFISNRDGPNPNTCNRCSFEIYVMNADGSHRTRLTNNPAFDSDPSWSPDGKRIAFVSFRDGSDGEIYVMRADGSEQTRLTNNPASDFYPSWSPDGQYIVFSSDRDGKYEIYMMKADGSEQTRLTNNPAYDSSPSWSPDGQYIAFSSDRDGNYEIYVMNADGSEQTRLTSLNNLGGWGVPHPVWSPDGQYIAFKCGCDGNNDIYVMKADGSEQNRLTNDTAWDEVWSWSADSQYIVFTSDRDSNVILSRLDIYGNRGGVNNIYVMKVDGSEQTRLTNDLVSDFAPKWQPTEK
jgi:Tol biopolymer transport system component